MGKEKSIRIDYNYFSQNKVFFNHFSDKITKIHITLRNYFS